MKGFRFVLVGLLVSITVLALVPTPEHAGITGVDKINHLAAFYVLALVSDFAFPDTPFDLRKVLILLGYGLAIEIAQAPLLYQVFSLWDVAADAAGLLCYAASLRLLVRLPVLRWRAAALRR